MIRGVMAEAVGQHRVNFICRKKDEVSMNSKEYDQFILEIIGNKHIKEGTVYYDKDYLLSLVISLVNDDLLGKYAGELMENSQGIKMCSIASSSRLCYLASKELYKDIKEVEKTDIKNGCCHPHYDGYTSSLNAFIFYEFKCHELCDGASHAKLSKSYMPLLKEYFDIEIDNLAFLKFSDFGFDYNNNGTIYDINFDTKQFICHILGILSQATQENKALLKYVWIIPGYGINPDLDRFIERIKEQIKIVFDGFSLTKVKYNGNILNLSDLIVFDLDVVPITNIKDFILESI